MKISKLHIDSFRHLENLDFDFTYPEDFHDEAKRGKPLDKICFIGQSATGKTGLLELIYDDLKEFHKIELDEDGKIWGNFFGFKGRMKIHKNNDIYEYINGVILKNDYPFKNSDKPTIWLSDLFDGSDKFFFFTTELLASKNLKVFEYESIFLIEKFKSKFSGDFDINKQVFDDNVDETIWIYLLKQNLNYLQNFLQFATELINSGSVLDSTSQEKVNMWKLINNNPLIEFSDKFNLILEKINLEVDLINTKNIIPLKHKISGENISIKNISTGTKQLLLTALPLFKLDTKDAIILIDEPERSLYPDMQMDLMEYYQNLAPEAQFIVATHSPFVAASFEPEERFILYFDDEGKVAVRRGSSPIGDDPNDILKNDFGINYYNKYGEEAYKKYIKLKEEVAKESDPARKRKLLLETVKLGDTYNF